MNKDNRERDLEIQIKIEEENIKLILCAWQRAKNQHLATMARINKKKGFFGRKLHLQAKYTNIGKGRGTIKSNFRNVFKMVDVYKMYMSTSFDYFKLFVQLTKEEFQIVIKGVEHRKEWLLEQTKNKGMTFENRILLTMRWIVCYEMYKTLAERYQVSSSYISVIISETMPILVEYFVTHIPHVCTSSKSSTLCEIIKFVIDATPTYICKPIADQHLWYRRDKKGHFTSTHILMDFDKYITAMSVNYMGHNVDSTCARNNTAFEEIVGNNLVLGDPGYQNVDYIVAGLEKHERNSKQRQYFYKVSYAEQKSIEHVNRFMKHCKSISGTFRHDHSLLSGCMLVCGGLYNMKRRLGHFVSLDEKVRRSILSKLKSL
ncbi:phosphoribosyl-AMP cyclohydrolase [Acrasis kona]|uniref:Phosphoribosyl-AMP cyclohydrolase n=1 Tax=Acrasis kona TaxID=1008807 RepID=A0AAW2YJL5_9EUKA